MKKIIKFAFLSLAVFPCRFLTAQDIPAPNPIFPHLYSADPSAHVWADGRLYVYCSHDVAPPRGCDLMDQYHVFSTDDMVNWTDHGEILRSTEVSWGRPEGGFMWAPDCAFKNGVYYFFFPHPSGSKWNDSWKIGVAASYHPAKDFKVIGYVRGMEPHIDPCVFVDDDGQVYIYQGGGGKCYGGKLDASMLQVEGKMQRMEGLEDFHEATWVHKRNGVYYLSYSDNHDDNWKDGVEGDNRMRYATSDSPLGPWKHQGIYMEPTDSYTNHGSIVEYKGQWYSFYHNSKLSEYNEKFNDWTRSVCVDKLFYNADGTIQKVEQTGYGITSNTMPQPAEGLQTKLFKTIDNGIEGELNSLFVRVEFYSPSVVRVYKTPLTELNRRRESRIINPSTEKTDFTVSEDFNYIYLKTAETTVEINKNNGEIHFCSTPNRKYLLLDKGGTSQFTPVANDKGWYRIKETFMLDKDEAVYGLGQIQDGRMSHRNQTIHLDQGNLDDGIPFFQSIKGYGLYWDNYSASTFSDSAEGTSFESEAGEAIDYYFILGGNADGVIRQIRKMTGDCDMFPLWGFGYLQSRERYQSQDELVSVVKKYRELGLPLDGIIQDWRYWGNDDKWNAVEFLDKGFKNPLKMMQDIHALHAHLLISIWPSFSSETTIYKELESENLLYNFKTFPYDEKSAHSVKVYDAFSSSATDIYWKYIKKNMFSKGVDGWWLDATEPEMIQMKPEDWKQPTAIGEFFKVRNLYPYASVGGVYNHQRSASASKRVFILTRSASFGQQRFSSHVWSGDTQASWETLQKQIPTGLNFSLTGIPYWNCDIGGFYFHNYPDKLQDADLRELYVRWFQFAAFCPMFRSHGTNAPREIYQFGKNGDMEYDILEQYLNLRYTLLPYIYSTSWQVTSSQGSMMRALAMDFARDRKVWDMGSEYMFGKSFLVCPVTTPLKNGAATEVYLPKGADWYDYWTNEKLQGGESVKKSTPLDVMPLYVRSGSIIPFAPVMQYATQKKWSDLEIRIYAGADGEFVLYEDENDNYNYQKGTYTAITFTWDEKARTLSVSDRKGSFPKMLLTRTFRITLQDGKNVAAKKITYTGKAQTVKF